MIFREPKSVKTAIGDTQKIGLRLFVEVTAFLKTFRTANTGRLAVRNVLNILETCEIKPLNEHTLAQVLSSTTDIVLYIDEIYANMPPIFAVRDEKKKPLPPVTEEPWDYNDRVEINIWLHRIASAYNWTRETILQLDPVEAAKYIQEIELDQIYEREFFHSLSEMAYSSDKSSGKMKYMPLKRPGWMIRRTVVMPPTQKLPKKFMPVGKVIDAKTIMEEMEQRTRNT